MGTWGAGVFENDAAEDLLEGLSLIDSGGRGVLLGNLLSTPSDFDEALKYEVDPAEVLAGIAVVAINFSDGPLFSGEEDYPEIRFWIDESMKSELQAAAVRALDRVEHQFQWYWRSWVDEGEKNAALAEVAKMREMISS